EKVRFLFECIAFAIFIDGGLDPPLPIKRQFAYDALGSKVVIPRRGGIGHENVEGRRSRPRRVPMLLGKSADDGRPTPVIRAREGRLWKRERIPAERRAAFVKFLHIAGNWHGRAGIAPGAM